jgi:cold shock CspA family protein
VHETPEALAGCRACACVRRPGVLDPRGALGSTFLIEEDGIDRMKGRIVRWKEGGFGFIKPASDDPEDAGNIFVHVSALPGGEAPKHLPVNVQYDVETTPKGLKAVNVSYVPEGAARRRAGALRHKRIRSKKRMRLSLSCDAGSFTKGQLLAAEKIKRAATDTVRDATQLAKDAGRQAIAKGGFGTRFQNTLRSTVYPKSGDSLNAAGYIFDVVDWAGVFETGATITASGKKLLWIALESAPVGQGGHRLSPSEYIAAGGKLISVNVPGKPPMLGTMVNDKAPGPWGRKRFTAKQLVHGGYKKGYAGTAMRFQPLYVGKAAVTDPQKFDVYAAVDKIADIIPELFAAHFAD